MFYVTCPCRRAPTISCVVVSCERGYFQKTYCPVIGKGVCKHLKRVIRLSCVANASRTMPESFYFRHLFPNAKPIILPQFIHHESTIQLQLTFPVKMAILKKKRAILKEKRRHSMQMFPMLPKNGLYYKLLASLLPAISCHPG